MKKKYIIPTIIVEETENDEMLMASGFEETQGLASVFVGGGDGNSHSFSNSINVASDDDEWTMGAKASFTEDFEYSIGM